MDPRVRRRRLLIIFGTLLAVPLIAAGVDFFVPSTGFSSEALHASVAREADRAMYGETGCDRHVKGGWSCSLADLSGSGFVDYRVVMEGGRCWHGVRGPDDAGKGVLPRNLHGCLKLRDQVRFWDRFWELVLGD